MAVAKALYVVRAANFVNVVFDPSKIHDHDHQQINDDHLFPHHSFSCVVCGGVACFDFDGSHVLGTI